MSNDDINKICSSNLLQVVIHRRKQQLKRFFLFRNIAVFKEKQEGNPKKKIVIKKVGRLVCIN